MQGIASACILVLIVFGSHQDVTSSKPKIIPAPSWSIVDEDVFLIQEKNELKIVCQGEGKIKVSEQHLPPYLMQSDSTGSFDEATGTYTFIRPRTVAEDTGWYACADESIEIKNDLETIDHPGDYISWIYVYVNSSAPLAGMGTLFEAITMVTGSDGVVPCRPTSPNLPVILEIGGGMIPVPEDTEYDPRIGFILKAVGKERIGETFECKVNGTYAEEPEWPLYYAIIEDVTGLDTPTINQDTLQHVVWGENMSLVCTITLYPTKFNINWTVPNSIPENRIVYDQKMNFEGYSGSKEIWKIKATIRDVQESDGGNYTCTAKSIYGGQTAASKEIKICDPNYVYINMSVDGEANISLPEGQTAVWNVKIDTYPETATFEWLKEDGSLITTTEDDSSVSKYSHTKSGITHLFKISKLTIEDSSRYMIRASTQYNVTSIELPLAVFGPPTVHIDTTSRLYAPGVPEIFVSRISASPQPNVTWRYIEHPQFPSKLNSTSISLANLHTERIERPPFHFASRVSLTINMTGDLICRSCNFVDCTEVTQQIFVSDVAGVFGIRAPGIVFVGDDINVTCGASVYKYTDDVAWRFEDFRNEKFESDRIYVTKLKTKFTSQSILHIRNVSQSDFGEYTCEAVNNGGQRDRETYMLGVEAARVPEFNYTNLNNSEIYIDLETEKNKGLTLDCRADGRPIPKITWSKNNEPLNESTEYRFSQNNTRLQIVYFFDADTYSGIYACKAENRIGTVERYMKVIFTGKSDSTTLWISLICVVIAIIIIAIAYTILKAYRKKILYKSIDRKCRFIRNARSEE